MAMRNINSSNKYNLFPMRNKEDLMRMDINSVNTKAIATRALCSINNKNTKLTTENSQSKTEHQSVSKIEACLEEARHLSLHIEVIYWVQVHINSCWGSREEWSPLPVIVLSIKQEICSHNCHANCYNNENQENKQHKPVHIVDLSTSSRSKVSELSRKNIA
jgi:hypothetical protein